MRWIPHKADDRSGWYAKSADGYYGVKRVLLTEGQREQQRMTFKAFHIPALWATPVYIDESATSDGAERICEEHSRRAPRSAAP